MRATADEKMSTPGVIDWRCTMFDVEFSKNVKHAICGLASENLTMRLPRTVAIQCLE